MSHSLEGKAARFIYSPGDFEEDVRVIVHSKRVARYGEGPCEVHIPMMDLLGFVAEVVRARRISEIEQAEVLDVLGLKKDADDLL